MEYYFTLYKEALTSFYSNWYTMLPILTFLLFASISDLQTLKIPNYLNRAFFMSRFLFVPWVPFGVDNIMGLVFGGLLILIPAMIMMKPMGGDIKLVAALGIWTNDAVIITSMLIGILLFVGYAFMKKSGRKEMIAFGPFVSLGYANLSIIVIGLGLLANFL